MTRDYANLSNCYKPLPFRPAATTKNNDRDVKTTTQAKQERIASSRDSGYDGRQSRSPRALRLLRMETGITSATGSALVELGHTKVLVEVLGPTTTTASADSALNMEEGTLDCQVNYVPNFGFPITSLVGASASNLSDSNAQQPQQMSMGRLNTKIAAQEKELASQLLASVSAAVPLQAYPKNVIVLQVTVLQDDGSVLSACTTAASLALVDACIEVYDMVTSSTVAVINPTNSATSNGNSDNNQTKKSAVATTPPLLLADPTHDEMAQADAVVQLSLLANWKEVTLWSQSGRLSSSVANEAITLCRDGCRTMHKFMRNALLLDDSPDDQDVKMMLADDDPS